MPHFLALLESHPNTNPNPALNPTTNPLNGKLDLDNMGAAGHSRGGKIAALHFAGVFDFCGGRGRQGTPV